MDHLQRVYPFLNRFIEKIEHNNRRAERLFRLRGESKTSRRSSSPDDRFEKSGGMRGKLKSDRSEREVMKQRERSPSSSEEEKKVTGYAPG